MRFHCPPKFERKAIDSQKEYVFSLETVFNIVGVFAVNICEELRKCCGCFARKPQYWRQGVNSTQQRGTSITSVNGRTTVTALHKSVSTASFDSRICNTKSCNTKRSFPKSSPRPDRKISRFRRDSLCEKMDSNDGERVLIPLMEYNTVVSNTRSNTSSHTTPECQPNGCCLSV